MRHKRFRLYVWSRTGNFSKFFDLKHQAWHYLMRKQVNKKQQAFSQGQLYDYDYQHKAELFVGWWDETGKWWTKETKEAYDKEQFGIWFNKFWRGGL